VVDPFAPCRIWYATFVPRSVDRWDRTMGASPFAGATMALSSAVPRSVKG
jgi:hypothetical protein